MKQLFERELEPQLARTDMEIINYARNLIDSNNARNWQMASELSYMLRRNNRHEAAVEVARMLFEKDPTVDKLNLYFVAVVDEGSFDKIRHLHETTDEYVQRHNNEYQKHLFATWLKAANRIQDDEMFNYVYSNIPSPEKTQNSYIISQYYVYLNRHGSYNEVIEHYKKLLPNMQNSFYVRKYYQNASSRMGFSSYNPGPYMEYASQYPPAQPGEPQNPPSESSGTASDGQGKRVFLVYGSQPYELKMVKFFLKSLGIPADDIAETPTGSTILDKFEQSASRTGFAIVILTPADEVKEHGMPDKTVHHARQNAIWEWGYFFGRLGKDNVAVLVTYGNVGKDKFSLPSDILGTQLIDMSHNWDKQLAQRLKASGFNVDPENLP